MIYHHNPLDFQTRRYLVWSIIALTFVFFLCVVRWQHQTDLPPLPLNDFSTPVLHTAPVADGITASVATQ